MKKIIIFLLMLLFAVAAKAQLFSYPDNGNVGIPAGYIELNAQVPSTNMYISPTISGSTYWNTNTYLTYTLWDAFSTKYPNNTYNPII